MPSLLGHLSLWLWVSWAPHLPLAHLPAILSLGSDRAPREDTQDLGRGRGLLCRCLSVTFKDAPLCTFGMRAPLSASLPLPPMYAAVGFSLSLLLPSLPTHPFLKT